MSAVRQYPRETVELLPVEVLADGVPVTTGVEICVVTGTDRPGSVGNPWVAASVITGATYYLIDSLAPGVWTVYTRYTSSPEVPVVESGKIQIV